MSVNGIEITEVKIHPVTKTEKNASLEAFVKVVLNGQLCINSIRIVRGQFGPFVSFPSQYNKQEEKAFQYCHPITKALHEYVSERILRQWQKLQATQAVLA